MIPGWLGRLVVLQAILYLFVLVQVTFWLATRYDSGKIYVLFIGAAILLLSPLVLKAHGYVTRHHADQDEGENTRPFTSKSFVFWSIWCASLLILFTGPLTNMLVSFGDAEDQDAIARQSAFGMLCAGYATAMFILTALAIRERIFAGDHRITWVGIFMHFSFLLSALGLFLDPGRGFAVPVLVFVASLCVSGYVLQRFLKKYRQPERRPWILGS